MDIDFSKHSESEIYFLMTQSIIPRPVAWILTENISGNFNLAPFSYFTAVSSAPPLLLFSIGTKNGGQQKDTSINFLREKRCVIHIAHEQQLDTLNQSAANLPYGESEVDANQLTLETWPQAGMPRLKDAPLAMACDLYRHDVIGDAGQNIFYAQVKHLYAADNCIRRSGERLLIDSAAVAPVARLGAGEYAALGVRHTLKRPD
jgi:flavin reductase (DIM6/NTAB) family NADH-FMN oxidoreductase RutF